MIRLPREIAGVASVISPSEFLPSTLNSGPAWITYVSPSSGDALRTSFDQRTLPVAKSTSCTIHRCGAVEAGRSPPMYSPGFGASACPLLITVVTKTWSPHTTGELQPTPGTSSVQTMFSVVLHRSGSAGSFSATPAEGPRNCGQ